MRSIWIPDVTATASPVIKTVSHVLTFQTESGYFCLGAQRILLSRQGRWQGYLNFLLGVSSWAPLRKRRRVRRLKKSWTNSRRKTPRERTAICGTVGLFPVARLRRAMIKETFGSWTGKGVLGYCDPLCFDSGKGCCYVDSSDTSLRLKASPEGNCRRM